MALWAQAQQLQGILLKQMQELYPTSGILGLEVRHSIAQWIEAQEWQRVDESQDESTASYLLETMVQQLLQTANNVYASDDNMFPFKLRLQENARCIKETYRDRPLELVRLIRSCLYREEQLVLMSRGGGMSPSCQNLEVSKTENEIMTELERTKNAVLEVVEMVRKQQQTQESFVLQYQHNDKLKEQIRVLESREHTQQNAEKTKMLKKEVENVDKSLKDKAQQMMALRANLHEHTGNTLNAFNRIAHNVLDIELVNWKNVQRAATFKTDLSETHLLNKIQKWCEELATVLNDIKLQLKKMEMLDSQVAWPTDSGQPVARVKTLQGEVARLLNLLLLKSLVIDRQPPQVVKKDARFTANIRLLVGNKLNSFMNMPTVEASVINELQARQIVRDGSIPSNMDSAGAILNNKGTMEYAQGQLTVTFRNMQLKKIKRADRKGQELVVEEKFCLLFRTKIDIQASLECELWVMSLPIVVTVHGNQDCQAQATILWDNAFSDPQRVPFTVPDQVHWNDLSSMLSCWFHHRTGKALTYDHLQYLAAKLFGENAMDFSNYLVTRAQFHKDQLHPSKWNFTFWEWLFAVQKLTKDSLKQLWMDGLIMGFVGKKTAQDLLMNCSPGTFLLRYSDTELGGISIVYNCLEPGKDNKIQVCNLSPFTDKDFRIRCLADRVKDLIILQYLYPETPKDQVFGKYWSREVEGIVTPGAGEYIPHAINMTIPGMPVAVPTNQIAAVSSPAPSFQQPLSNITTNSMDLSDYQDDDFSSYLSGANNEFGADELHEVIMNQFLN